MILYINYVIFVNVRRKTNMNVLLQYQVRAGRIERAVEQREFLKCLHARADDERQRSEFDSGLLSVPGGGRHENFILFPGESYIRVSIIQEKVRTKLTFCLTSGWSPGPRYAGRTRFRTYVARHFTVRVRFS